MNSPVFLDLFQFIYSYLQIVNIETDEDITGLNFFTDSIRKQVYTRYDESFIIASPLLYGNILETGGPIADVTLQLAAKVLTQKRTYMQLIDVLGDVGGLMEILYTFLNIISSFLTEVLYDQSLVNNLFSFDLDKKYVVFNKIKIKNKYKRSKEDNNSVKDLYKEDENNIKQKSDYLDNNKDIEIYQKENIEEKDISVKKMKKGVKKRRSSKNAIIKSSKSTLAVNNELEFQKDKNENNEIKISSDENKNIMNIYNAPNDSLRNNINERDLSNVYINNWLICCFSCTSRKKNVNKILLEEGSRILTERLDIMNMFNKLYAVDLMQKQLGIEPKGINMSDIGKSHLKVYNNLIDSNSDK